MLMSGEKAIQILLRDGTLSGVMVVESAAWENGVIYSACQSLPPRGDGRESAWPCAAASASHSRIFGL